jgi:hypothetical protein
MMAKIQISFEANSLQVWGALHPEGLDVSELWAEAPSRSDLSSWGSVRMHILGDMTARLFMARAAQFN